MNIFKYNFKLNKNYLILESNLGELDQFVNSIIYNNIKDIKDIELFGNYKCHNINLLNKKTKRIDYSFDKSLNLYQLLFKTINKIKLYNNINIENNRPLNNYVFIIFIDDFEMLKKILSYVELFKFSKITPIIITKNTECLDIININVINNLIVNYNSISKYKKDINYFLFDKNQIIKFKKILFINIFL